jgi:hypothetical protein
MEEEREMLKNILRTLKNHWGGGGEEAPFIANQNSAVGGQNSGKFRSKVGLAGPSTGPPGAQPVVHRSCTAKPPRDGFR